MAITRVELAPEEVVLLDWGTHGGTGYNNVARGNLLVHPVITEVTDRRFNIFQLRGNYWLFQPPEVNFPELYQTWYTNSDHKQKSPKYGCPNCYRYTGSDFVKSAGLDPGWKNRLYLGYQL